MRDRMLDITYSYCHIRIYPKQPVKIYITGSHNGGDDGTAADYPVLNTIKGKPNGKNAV